MLQIYWMELASSISYRKGEIVTLFTEKHARPPYLSTFVSLHMGHVVQMNSFCYRNWLLFRTLFFVSKVLKKIIIQRKNTFLSSAIICKEVIRIPPRLNTIITLQTVILHCSIFTSCTLKHIIALSIVFRRDIYDYEHNVK